MSEICQRCNDEGYDRRTLTMRCFYEMGELGLPFSEDAEGFYSLRVCKSCRADWLQAIKVWFETKPVGEQEAGPGETYVRHLGSTKVIAIDDLESRKP